ncbi:ATP-dependent DNA ligase [Candidatus Collierbacteria bacterium]|nr:ATP-dependent DNA ligase [Candidatus Collierbacteria bacterium]
MLFKDFADRLALVDGETSRLKITKMLALMLKELETKEVRKAVYLMLGGLEAPFRSIEFMMADKMVIRAMAKVSGMETEEVNERFKKLGDLGLVMEQINKSKRSAGLNLMEVYRMLRSTALESGEGSQERKVESLSNLLAKLNSIEVKFVVRIVLNKLRLGFSDKTVLDALSYLANGDKSARTKLESAYQVLPDIGLLAEKVISQGIEKATYKIEPVLGVPVMSMLCQRLKSPAEMIIKMGEVAVEPKFDGTRVQIHFDKAKNAVRTFTRNLKESSAMFPELKKMGDFVSAESVILDCEAIGLNEEREAMVTFQKTMQRKRKHDIEAMARAVPVKFYVFDILFKDGISLLNETYLKRREILEETIKPGGVLMLDDYRLTFVPEEIRKWHKQMLDKGLEGVIVKRLGSRYVPGRTGWRWVKMKEVEESAAKLSDTIDAVIMGYSYGQGKRASFGIGKFLVGIKDGKNFKTLTRVGTGLKDEDFRQLKVKLDRLMIKDKPENYLVTKAQLPDVWVEPGVVVEIAGDEITKSPSHTAGVALRFPRMVRLRQDKGPEQVTTVSELKELAV